MARTVTIETRKRGLFGKIFKWTFIIFNLVMPIWLVSYWATVGETMKQVGSEAARTGATIGATLGTGFIVFFWAAGAIVLGLFTMFTRGKKIMTTETVE